MTNNLETFEMAVDQARAKCVKLRGTFSIFIRDYANSRIPFRTMARSQFEPPTIETGRDLLRANRRRPIMEWSTREKDLLLDCMKCEESTAADARYEIIQGIVAIRHGREPPSDFVFPIQR